MKRLGFAGIVLLLVFAVGLSGCQTVKDVIYDNKDLIKLIIQTIVEQLLEQAKPPVIESRGLSKAPMIDEVTRITMVLQSDEFWDDLSPKIDTLIKTYKDKANGSR